MRSIGFANPMLRKNITMNTFTKNTLSLHELRHTTCREAVLMYFKGENIALSHGNIDKYLSEQFDRVTIYRTLKTFVEKGILHKVLDEDGLRYALCKEACASHDHHHDHVHFKCTTCNKTICLDDIHVPTVQLPSGFKRQEVNLLIQGICDKC
jgi:Fur family transcriptional regulator, ferric uptake regulator